MARSSSSPRPGPRAQCLDRGGGHGEIVHVRASNPKLRRRVRLGGGARRADPEDGNRTRMGRDDDGHLRSRARRTGARAVHRDLGARSAESCGRDPDGGRGARRSPRAVLGRRREGHQERASDRRDDPGPAGFRARPARERDPHRATAMRPAGLVRRGCRGDEAGAPGSRNQLRSGRRSTRSMGSRSGRAGDLQSGRQRGHTRRRVARTLARPPQPRAPPSRLRRAS